MLNDRDKGVLYHYWLANDQEIHFALYRFEKKWFTLPSKTRRMCILHHRYDLDSCFGSAMQQLQQATMEDLLPKYVEHALVREIKSALGDDVEISLMGSRTRGTSTNADSDLDLQVRRTGDGANENFTREDKENVLENLERLEGVSELRMRSVAIKFVVQGRHGLRGGPDFYKNSARINRVLEKFPPARAGVIWVKTLFRGRKRPKGILLEAIAANLTETFPLTPRDINIDQRILDVTTLEADNVDGYQFLKRLLHELCDWKRSIFRDALRQDLRKLPARKRAELLEVFEDMRRTKGEVDYMLLEASILEMAFWSWTPQKGPLHQYIQELFHKKLFLLKRYAESFSPPSVPSSKGFGGVSSYLQLLKSPRPLRAKKR